MSPVSKQSHHIVFEKPDASLTTGLMLAKTEQGLDYIDRTLEEFPDVLRTGEATFATAAPKRRFTKDQTTWDQGFGLWRAKKGEELTRYAYSDGVDLRFANRANLGPIIEAATDGPAHFLIANSKFEEWTNSTTLKKWTKNGLTTTKESTIVQEGLFSCRLDATGAHDLSYSLANPTNYRGEGITFTIAIRVPAGETLANFQIRIDDGIGTSTSGNPSATDTWETLSVTRSAIDGAATQIKLMIMLSTSGDRCYVDDSMVRPDPGDAGVKPVAVAVHNKIIHMAVGQMIVAFDETNDVWDCVRFEDSLSFTDLEQYDGRLYAARATANSYIYSGTASPAANADWTVSTLTTPGDKAEYFKTVRDTLFKARTPNLVNSSTNPVNGGSWSTDFTVGDGDTDIVSLETIKDLLFVGREDGIWGFKRESEDWSGGTDRFIELFPEFRTLIDADNFKKKIGWNNRLYFADARIGLYEIDVASLTMVARQPVLQGPSFSDYGGKIEGLGGDADWLWAVLDTPTSDTDATKISLVLAGRLEGGKFIWHTMTSVEIGDVDFAFADTTSVKAIYVVGRRENSLHSELEFKCSRIILPTRHANPALDLSPKFQTVGQGATVSGEKRPYLVTPWYDANLLNILKAWVSFTLESEDLSGTSQTITLEYQLDDAKDTDAWKTLTDGVFDTSPIEIKYFQTEVSTEADRSSRRIRFRLSFYTDDDTKTPLIRGYSVEALIRGTFLSEFVMTCRLADGIAMLNGNPDPEPAKTKKSNLKSIRDNTWPAVMFDIDNTKFNVEIEDLRFETVQMSEGKYEERVRILCKEAKTTA